MDRNSHSRNGKSPISSSNNLGDQKELNQHDYIFSLERVQQQIPIPQNFPPKEQSLLQMFNAELFTTEYLIEYLYKKFETPGVHEYLVNKLYAVPHYEMDFYISFIVYLVITRPSVYLEQFLASLSQQNLSFYLKMLWILQAYSDSCKLKSFKGWQERMEKLERLIEMGMVNSAVNNDLLMQAQKENITEEETQLILEKFKDKEHRSNYNSTLNKFISNIIKISIYLKQYQENERKQRLREYIEKLNNFLHQNRINQKGIIYFQGILIPFSKQQGEVFHSNLVVNIVEDEFMCFNTKKRAPYKIVFETVDMDEMKEHMYYFEKLNRKNSVESDEMEELQQVKADKIDEVDKEKFRGLAKWAEIMKKEEQSKQKKSIIQKLLNVQKNDNIEVEHYTIHKLDTLVLQVQQGTLRNSSPKKVHQVVKQTSMDPDRLQKFEANIKVFNKNFPQKQNVNRRNSLATICYNPVHIEGAKIKQRRKSIRDLKIKDAIDLFRFLKQNYQNKYQFINKIYKYLHYDVIEQTVYTQNPDQDLKEIQFPRVFGPWGELWEDKQQVIKEQSPFRILKSYKLRPFIIKGGDDLRQELLIMQLIQKFHEIFKQGGVPLYLRPYEIIVASESSGFIEFLPNTLSIDALKKKYPKFTNLYEFYRRTFNDYFEEAQKNFIESLAGYSLICYLLQIKDRHNGNILIDNQGHIIHIDFGFTLSIAPGGIKFETAHFKLTNEYVALMGGRNSDQFGYYKSLLVRAFIEIKKHVNTICNLVQIMCDQSNLPCFDEFDMIQFRGRFKENFTDKEFIDYVDELIKGSCDKWSTNQYDKFQLMQNGILP
ncbi:phosphatidylinositol 4-kinase (macronuclear) [Tetrahymena thermophila SB210]|uniref:1-phosphatidylinositol 4-kinase n=1 Tax=Tetrahymena thermophila (strain SB210) TaxID=312017 RepID=Q22WE1_TETTS|nr:phosphatidylinositol 4-kinase [Tetrahymena thermophila SB210]EAR89476.2 phosphatidylinositol 4-kinase [Tetrahymena thermophila SB210]|eukprot:XP_001009721.2 phosphatidylinositol 4-kinase [Tetrahymena thermophila SB210]